MQTKSVLACAMVTLTLLVSGCTGGLNIGALGGGGILKSSPTDTPRPLTTAQVQTKTLPAAPTNLGAAVNKTGTEAGKDAPAPNATSPQTAPTSDPPAPAAPKSPQEAACLESGGRWSRVGNTITSACVRPAKDAGKSCTKESDCSSQCLARSRTCAPIWPIFGCSDVIQNNGAVVKLCLQ